VKTIPSGELEKLQGLDVLVISALRKKEHFSHQTLGEALEMIRVISPRTAYLTHISHELGLHGEVQKSCPKRFFWRTTDWRWLATNILFFNNSGAAF